MDASCLKLYGTGVLSGAPLDTDLRLHRAVLRGGICVSEQGDLPPREGPAARGSIGAEQPPRYDPALIGGAVPAVEGDDPELASLLRYPVPLVIRRSGLLGRAGRLWNFDYLDRHFSDVGPFIVMKAPRESKGRFAYYDMSPDKNPCKHEVTRSNEKLLMRFCEFRRELAKLRRGGASTVDRDMLYLQNTLLYREEEDPGRPRSVGGFGKSCGMQVAADIEHFEWDWLERMMGGKQPQMCQLFCGTAGGFSPCHYDPQDNLFAQVCGYKRVLLFHPKHFAKLYPWPVHHPQDRQSRVDFDAPDADRFPRFRELAGQGLEAILGPGDVLRIPPGWWHHVEMLRGPHGGGAAEGPDVRPGDEAVSINFWFRPPVWHHGSIEDGSVSWDQPLYGVKRVLFQRSVEELIGKLCGPHVVLEVLEKLLRFELKPERAGAMQPEGLLDVQNFVSTVYPDKADRTEFIKEIIAGRFGGLFFSQAKVDDTAAAADLTTADQEIEEMQRKVMEMEEEAEELKKLTDTVDEGIVDREEIDKRSVYVGNVDYGSTPEELQEHFKSCGQINRITIPVDRYSGQPKGFAYLEFADEEHVQNSLLLNGSLFRGRQLKVIQKRTNLPGFHKAGKGKGKSKGKGKGSYIMVDPYFMYPSPYMMPRVKGFKGYRPY